MNKPMLILYLEDDPRDAELVRDKLQQSDIVCELRVAINRAEYEAALAQTRFDLILSDYRLPDYDGMAALAFARGKQPDVPFILISGTLGEEQAVDCVLRGTNDYVLKQRLARLLPAIKRALSEAEKQQKLWEAEAELLASKQILEGIINAIPVRVFWKDRSLVYVGCNTTFARDAGFADPKDIIGKDDTQFRWSEHAETYRADDRQVIESGSPKLFFEEPMTTPEGNKITLLTSKIPMLCAKGEISGIIGTYMDITERKKAEEEIARNSEIQAAMNALLKMSIEINNMKEFLGSALDLLLSLKWLSIESKGAVFLTDESKNTLHLQVQRGFPEELLTACSSVQFGKCLCGRAAEERTIQFADCIDWRHDIRIDGILPHGHCCVPILSGDHVLGVLNLYVRERHSRIAWEDEFLVAVANLLASAIERNKTEEEKANLELQLRESRKMEAVGQLAGGISHDFNNLLSVINGYSEMLIKDPGFNADAKAHIAEILRAGERAAGLTRQLLVFSRRQTVESRIINLDEIISGIEKMLRRLIRENIIVKKNVAQGLWQIKADSGNIEQVIMNLVINASDAMPDGGTLTVETGNVEIDETNRLAHPPDIKSGPYVMLSVIDTGCGMDDKIREHIFELFFTTKEVGKGTGLGLATVYGIVKQSNGYIDVQSELGKGTAFRIYFPQAADESTANEKPQDTAMISRGSETILLAEDKDSLRIMLQEFLHSGGYNVLPACNGQEALELAKKHKGEIQLLITDVVMPGMNGFELSKDVSSLLPEIKLLFMSGYNEPTDNQTMMKFSNNFIHKPLSLDALSAKIREILDKEAEEGNRGSVVGNQRTDDRG